MLGQQLQFDPGSRSEYSNFGYCVLGRVVEKASGKTYFNYVREEILQPTDIHRIKLAHDAVKNRDPEEAYYPAEVLVQVMDSHGGLIRSRSRALYVHGSLLDQRRTTPPQSARHLDLLRQSARHNLNGSPTP